VTLLDHLRFRFLPSKAQLEFQAIQHAQNQKIPTSSPVGFGHHYHKGWLLSSYLLIESLPHVQPFNIYFQNHYHTLSPSSKKQLLYQLATTLAYMHRCGVLHADFHAGNLLYSPTLCYFWIIDIYKSTQLPRFHLFKSLKNLVTFHRPFHLKTSRSDRLRFFRSYLSALTPPPAPPQPTPLKLQPLNSQTKYYCRLLEKWTRKAHFTFWKHREKRCLKENKYFGRIRLEGYQGYSQKNPETSTPLVPPETLKMLLPPPLCLPPSVQWVKKGSNTTRLLRLQGEYYLKHYLIKPFPLSCLHVFRQSRARKAWSLGHSLLTREILTAEPLLFLEKRRWGLFLQDSFILFKRIPEHQALRFPPPHLFQERQDLIQKLSHAIRQFHDKGFTQRDLKGPNLLQGKEGIYFIDVDGMQQKCKLKNRSRDLGRLLYWYRFEEPQYPWTPQEGDFLIKSYFASPCPLPFSLEKFQNLVQEYLEKKTRKKAKKAKKAKKKL
jgi:serine/threonine protein kinase